MTQPKILSVQVGKPATIPPAAPGERPWRSAIVKSPVDGPVMLNPLNLVGDEQHNKKVHGGPFRAVNFYPAEHYNYWRQTPELAAMTGGAFGENLTTEGLLEDTVCIGDVYQVGQAGSGPIIRITSPRGPCTKLNRRWHSDDLMDRSIAAGRIGWYGGVAQPGMLAAGDALTLVERPNPTWSIARVWAIQRDNVGGDALRELAQLPGLAEGWREMALERLSREASK